MHVMFYHLLYFSYFKTNMPRVQRQGNGDGPRRNNQKRKSINISVLEDLVEDTGKTLHTKDGQVLIS